MWPCRDVVLWDLHLSGCTGFPFHAGPQCVCPSGFGAALWSICTRCSVVVSSLKERRKPMKGSRMEWDGGINRDRGQSISG